MGQALTVVAPISLGDDGRVGRRKCGPDHGPMTAAQSV